MSEIQREVIWEGEVEWHERGDRSREQRIKHNVPCTISSIKENGVTEMVPNNWPQKLIMQLIPKSLVQTLGVQYFSNSKSVLFHPSTRDIMKALLGELFAGCVHFPGAGEVKVLILIYSSHKDAYLGFIPNEQNSFVDRIRKVVQQQKNGQGRRQAQSLAQQGGLEEIEQQAEDGKEQIFIENGREVRRIPVKLNSGEICWMECV